MKLKQLIQTLLLAAIIGVVGITAGCNSRSADAATGINNKNQNNNDNDNKNNNNNNEPGFCEDSSQLFTIVWIHPQDEATNVATGTNILLRFNHPPAKQSIRTGLNKGLISLTTNSGKTVVDLKLADVNKNLAVITQTNPPLKKSTTYTLSIAAKAVQAAACAKAGVNPKYLTFTNNAGEPITNNKGKPVDEVHTSFTTGKVNQLSVVDTNPDKNHPVFLKGTSEVISITFNKPIQTPVVCNGTSAAISLHDTNGTPGQSNDTQVDGNCKVPGKPLGSKVIFLPNKTLQANEKYRLVIEADGVQPHSKYVKPLQQDKTVKFRVVVPPPPANQCTGPVANVCVTNKNGPSLVGRLLDEGKGPLAPLVEDIGGKDKLVNVLSNLLRNDNGSLASVVRGLIQEGHLQEALRTLLLDKENGLRTILPQLLTGLPELAKDGAGELLKALLTGANAPACQAELGTVCLVGSGERLGVLDVLIGDGGYLGSTGLSQQELVDILGNTLQNDGSLRSLVKGLFQEHHLVEGLKALLIGNAKTGGQPGLLNTLQSLGKNLPSGVIQTLGKLLGVGDASNLSSLGELLGQIPGLGKVLGGLGNLTDDIPVLGDIFDALGL